MDRESRVMMKPQTLYEKLFQQHVVAEKGDGTVLLYIDRHLIHEVTSPQAFEGLRTRGRPVRRPDWTLATSDHNVPTTSRSHFKNISTFITEPQSRLQCLTLERNTSVHNIPYFGLSSRRQGIVHVIGPELGFTQPGLTLVCGDSHTSTHGAFGALAFGIGTTEVEHVLATQTLIATRSGNMKVEVEGELGQCVSAKDVALYVIGKIGTAGGTGMVIEFGGSAIRGMSMEARMALCNMSIEAGARAGMVAPDDVTVQYLRGKELVPAEGSENWQKALRYWATLQSDPGARFDRTVRIDADDIVPTVSWGTSPEQVIPVTGRVPYPGDFKDKTKQESCERALKYMGLEAGTRVTDIPVDKVFIGSCTNARIEDFRSAARVLKGRRISPNLKIALAVPGSGTVKSAAEAEGLDVIFKKAGFEWREAGCSLCVGLNEDMLLPFERCASTSNRNFESRQGTAGRTHLMSPAMAAAAAIEGKLADACSFPPAVLDEVVELAYADSDSAFSTDGEETDLTPVTSPDSSESSRSSIDLASPLPCDLAPTAIQTVKGIVAPLARSNIDTDCIMPKQFCKTIQRSGLGAGLFHNLRYDESGQVKPDFILNQPPYQHRTRILLVTGANFGCGSSREHAVWALLDYGIQCVMAPSFADIFYNNAFKNGLLPVKVPSPELLAMLELEARAGREITVDLVQQKIFDEAGRPLGAFTVEEHRRDALLSGRDDIDSTLSFEESIALFEKSEATRRPWVQESIKQLLRPENGSRASRERKRKVDGNGDAASAPVSLPSKAQLAW